MLQKVIKNVNNKKCAPRLVFIKSSNFRYENWQVRFLHFLTTLNNVYSQNTIIWISFELSMFSFNQQSIWYSPFWYVLEFWKIKLEKSSSTNWIFSLQKSISKSVFAGYTGSKNLIEIDKNLDFPNWFFRNQVKINRGIVLVLDCTPPWRTWKPIL
jgi:hypothetical protein